MAYNPTVWEENDLLSADRMNKIEQGIVAASESGGSGIETEITGSTNFFKLYGIETDNDSVQLKIDPTWVINGSITVTKNDTLDDVVSSVDAAKASGISNIYFDSNGVLHFTDEDIGSMVGQGFQSTDGSVTYKAVPERVLVLPQPMSKFPDDVDSLLKGGSPEHENTFVDYDTIRKVMDFTSDTHENYTGEENFFTLYGIDSSTAKVIYFKFAHSMEQYTINSTATVSDVANEFYHSKFSKTNGRFYDTGSVGIEVARVYADSAYTKELFPSYERVYNPSIPAESITKIVVLSEEEHAALTEKPTSTLYLIPEEE